MILVPRALEVGPGEFLLVDETQYLAIFEEIDVCIVYQVVFNQVNYLLITPNTYFALRYCTPVNTIICLGKIYDNTQIFYTFDLFRGKKDALFFLQALNLNGSDIINFKVKTIHQLKNVYRIASNDFLYYFHNELLYKMSYDDFASKLSNFSRCGEYLGNNAQIFSNQYFVSIKTINNKVNITLSDNISQKLYSLQQQVNFLKVKVQELIDNL